MNKYLGATILAISVTSCVVQPTAESKSIRLVDKQSDYNCKFITTVTGSGDFGISAAQNAEGAMNEARNKAAKAGANAIRVVDIGYNRHQSAVVAEALECDLND